MLRQARRPGQLVGIIDRKPYLRSPVLNLGMPPKARRPDPGALLGIDFSRMRSASEIAAAMERVVGALCRGEVTPGEAALLARRSRKPLRAFRRLMWREIALLKGRLPSVRPGPKPLGRERRRLRRRLARLAARPAVRGPPACVISAAGCGPPPDRAFGRHVSAIFGPARVDAGAANPILHRPGVRRLRFRDI